MAAGAGTMHVLLVDQGDEQRQRLTDLLAAWGYRLTAVASAEAAEALAERMPIDIVLADMNLPGKNGIELCWDLRCRDAAAFQYLMIITGEGDVDRNIEALDGGADDFVLKPIQAGLLRARLRLGERLVRQQRDLHRLATTDPLTGLLNRRSFFETATAALARRRPGGDQAVIAILDLDHFKRVNDGWGHHVGDRVIVDTARVLAARTQSCGYVGRLGGEEFALLLAAPDRAGAVALGEELRSRIAALEIVEDARRVAVTASLGLAMVDPDDPTIDRALAQADMALYHSKHAGRNRVTIAPPGGLDLPIPVLAGILPAAAVGA